MNAPLLELRKLARHYRVRSGRGWFSPAQTLRAVSEVSLQVRSGQTVGLVGESGCGKSTTARLSLGLTSPTSGQVLFEGRPVPAQRNAHWKDLRQRMQMVYQDPLSALDRRLGVMAQVIEPLSIFRRGSPASRRERAARVLGEVGLSESLWQRYPHELSGGQRQRVVLARALVLKPSLLVCDEPISALDVSIQAQVINLLTQTQQQRRLGMLFISHDLKVVRQVCDEVAVMYLGRIVEQGTPEQLFTNPVHPYTEALISAIPTIQRGKVHRRILLKGDPPNPINIPGGCAFHPRCPIAKQACRETSPVLREAADGRRLACLYR
ncbi:MULTISPECIES: ABC transporter ATP-binding protein [unclassified Bordetella]|uniref:ABC transporter ATP-binding protein n=1 Tax=unclassified Bordetella TaxID=2630031 RepID=UPI0013295F33|nr:MULTISPECIES: oligopeptide/dipeptide ABC transporter ATP-binding protein [unclassified Bordetella]MVW71160.1 ATP-binding cassette domain-containing protein [Bordetella sp. 15P40C-2]MVW80729.1 ATP-binding cassette domain-containing protein [Bordetella sp. 02P26C-1]